MVKAILIILAAVILMSLVTSIERGSQRTDD
jgi:hypothetical protein